MISGNYLFIVVLLLFLVVVPLWAVIDASKRPADGFYAAGYNKTKWIFAFVLGTFLLTVVGTIVSIRYLVGVRPLVKQATTQGDLPVRPRYCRKCGAPFVGALCFNCN
jgi:hypothetical protein